MAGNVMLRAHRKRSVVLADPVGATLASESWTGSDGAPWSGQWTDAVDGASIQGSRTVQGNRGRLTPPNFAFGGQSRGFLSGMTAVADCDLLVDFATPTATDQIVTVMLRCDGAPFGNDYAANGYMVAAVNGTATLSVVVNGTNTSLGTVSYTPSTTATTRLRFRAVGSSVKVRLWPAAGTEPATWGVAVTNSAITAAGKVWLGTTNLNTVTYVEFDNLTLRAATAGGGPTTPGASVGADPSLLPFAETSPWRLGVATTAVLAAASDPRNTAMHATGTDGDGSVWVNQEQNSHPVNYAAASDPLATMTDTAHGAGDIPAGGSWSERIPTTAIISAGSDLHMHVITPDRLYVQEHIAVARQSSTAYTCQRRHLVDLTGSGIGPQNGVRAYGGSAIGGLIRSWEVDSTNPHYTGAIRHPLAAALRYSQLYYNGVYDPDEGFGDMYGSDGYGLAHGYVWPATEQDYLGAFNYSGTIPMGSYFVIPPTVDVTTLGLGPEGLMVAKAAQDYGVYVTDCADPTQSFYVEDDNGGPARSWFLNFINHGGQFSAHDPRIIFNNLRVVTNNSAATPNGGALGAARRA